MISFGILAKSKKPKKAIGMIKIAKILFLNTLIFVCWASNAQADGSVFSKEEITKDSLLHTFSKFKNPDRFVKNNDDGLDWHDSFKFLDDYALYKIIYFSDGLKVAGYVYEPRKEGKYPGIIYNRGGNREFGMLNPARMVFLFGSLLKEGYVIAASNYRGVDGGEGMEEFGGREVNDILNLIPILEQNPKADASLIGMYGWSRGGMMSYLTLTRTKRIKALVVGGAVSDLFETIADRPDMETHVIAELVPDYQNNKESALNDRSAIKWVDKFPKNVPILMMHGTADWRVKPEQSMSLALEFQKYKVPYRLIMMEGGDHGLSEFREETNRQTIDWFQRFLKNQEALPDLNPHGR